MEFCLCNVLATESKGQPSGSVPVWVSVLFRQLQHMRDNMATNTDAINTLVADSKAMSDAFATFKATQTTALQAALDKATANANAAADLTAKLAAMPKADLEAVPQDVQDAIAASHAASLALVSQMQTTVDATAAVAVPVTTGDAAASTDAEPTADAPAAKDA